MTLFGNVEDCFKPALNKTPLASLRNIDYIYVINLDERPEKFKQTYDQLIAWCIQPYRFSAVNGWKLSLEEINNVGVSYEPWMKKNLWGTCYLDENSDQPTYEIMKTKGRNYFTFEMSKGAIGITLSHLSVLQDAYDSSYERIWVMEDDIYIPQGQDPNEICDLIDDLNNLVGCDGWDILFTDPDTKGPDGKHIPCCSCALRPNVDPDIPSKFALKKDLNETFMQIGARYGAYSMIVNRSGMEKILNFIKKNKIFLPYDLEYVWPDNIRLFSIKRDIVSTLPGAMTDNAYPGYKRKSP
jgi:GR25 family glycosyltransferase involved in LPS biosynthesis